MSAPSVSKFGAWVIAARPKTLPAAVGPVLVGAAAAYRDGYVKIFVTLLALLGAVSLQILSNFANDYFDFIKGIDNEKRVGPTRALQAGLLSKKEMQVGILMNIIVSGLIGLYLIYVGGWPILAIGVCSIIFAILYSGGPYPLSTLGLGDLFVFVFFGLIAVPGTYYVISGTIPQMVFLLSVPVGFLITAILVVNNYRDYDLDLEAGKKTFSHLLGKTGTRYYYAFLVFSPFLVPIYLLIHEKFSAIILLPLIALPLAIKLVHELWNEQELPRLNPTLAGTARLSLIYGILLSIGLIFS